MNLNLCFVLSTEISLWIWNRDESMNTMVWKQRWNNQVIYRCRWSCLPCSITDENVNNQEDELNWIHIHCFSSVITGKLCILRSDCFHGSPQFLDVKWRRYKIFRTHGSFLITRWLFLPMFHKINLIALIFKLRVQHCFGQKVYKADANESLSVSFYRWKYNYLNIALIFS